MDDSETSLAFRVRALRLLKGWSHADLAEAAHVARSVVADLELGRQGATEAAKAALLEAVTPATIDPGGEHAPARAGGQPLRWITATDLTTWGGTRRGQDTLPELINRLIRAEYGVDAGSRFPSGDSVAQAGWDGQSLVPHATEFVPAGGAGWEIGAGRKAARTKADEDWAARTAEAEPPASEWLGARQETTFVFVTAHRWRDKEAWAKLRGEEDVWMDVRVLDADSLVQWIERHPAVAQWLAIELGKRPPDLRTLGELWADWALATQAPLSAELSVVGRDAEAAATVRWLGGAPSVFSVQADSVDEAAAFLFACIAVLPEAHRETYLSRAVAPQTEAAAREVATALTPLILVLRSADAGFAATLARQGHHVFVANGPEPVAGGAIALTRPTRWDLLHGLLNLDIAYDQAERLSRDAGRSLTTLRRIMPPAPGRQPAWATTAPPRALMAALLAGGWLDANAADREILERLSGLAYDEFERAITPYLVALDGPLRKTEAVWRLKSPLDAWGLLAPALTDTDVRNLLAAADALFGEVDPTFALAPAERWLAPVKGVASRFSGALVRGVADTLILLCLREAAMPAVRDARARVEQAIGDWLRRATAAQWWSLAPVLPSLAEAAPEAFLQATRTAMAGEAPPITALFEVEDARRHTTSQHIHLIWALEGVAWDATYLGEAVDILAGLTRFDPGGRNVTRPEEQLTRIFLAWSPQTNAKPAVRLAALDALRRNHPDLAWRVMLKAVPSPGGLLVGGHRAKWRDDASDRRGDISDDAVEDDTEALAARLGADVGRDPKRWESLLEILGRLSPISRARIGQTLLLTLPEMVDPAARAELRTALRKFLARNNEFQDAWWAIPSDELADFASAYGLLEPADPLWRHAWRFSNGAAGARYPHDWLAAEGAEAAARGAALQEIVRDQGLEGLRALRGLAGRADWVAEAILELDEARGHAEVLIHDGLPTSTEPAWALASALIQGKLGRDGREAITPWLEKSEGDPGLTVRLLLLLRSDPDVWRRAAASGAVVETLYWRELRRMPSCETAGDLATAVDKLISVRRAKTAAALVERNLESGVAPDLVFGVLEEILQADQTAKSDEDEPDEPWGAHEIARLFAYLAALPDIDRGRLLRLEWAYFELLIHTEHPALTLRESLASDPSAFVDLLKLAYLPDEASGILEPPLDENLKRQAAQAWRVLDNCRPIPGYGADGEIDAAALLRWTVDMRAKAQAVGRLEVADTWLGKTLTGAASLAETPWPPAAIAALLEAVDSERLRSAFEIGALHRRGVTVRMPSDGGRQEEAQAAQYRRDAETLASAFPVTSRLLRRIAEGYLDQARREDIQAEHHAWSG